MLTVALIIFCYMLFWFFLGIYLRDNSVVDIGWGLGFVVIAWFMFLQSLMTLPQWIVTVLVTIWGLRLAIHIFLRHNGEDWRYRQWRDEWTWVKTRAFFQVYMLQGIFMWIIALPIIMVYESNPDLRTWTIIGTIVWTIGFFFEAVGDWQLARFVRTRKPGEIMTTGLWRYTRHPNYFGEVVLWWGLYLIAAPVSWWTIVSPIAVTFLLLKVSGIPMLERKYKGNPQFEAYKQRTNAFFPASPRNEPQ